MRDSTWSDVGIPLEGRGGYGRPVRLQILGPLQVTEGNGPIPLGGPKQRAVLAHLLLRANHLVPTEVLIDDVWGDEPPEAARKSLQAYASNLRKALGSERLEGSRAGYVLHADPTEVDAFHFQALLRDARRLLPIEPKAAVRAFDEALTLWRGPAFADLAEERSLLAEAARLDELRLAAIEDRCEALLTLGEHAEVIGELEALTVSHPLRERLWGQLVLAFYRAGRQADALAAYRRAREILADELGIDPSPELRRLHERILQQSPELEISGSPLRGYRLLERIGSGSFGAVWRALQPEVGRDVAVKAIHPHLANDPDFIRRFETEAQIVARLEHPHVVPLYDYWREPGGAYLVMRYLRGGNLAQAIGSGPLEPERVGRLLDQVGGALAAADHRGVVHRDVKPSNILLDEEGNAYLADFGIAKDTTAPDATEPGTVKGTLAYLAPEQIRRGTVTPRTDLYALGVVLYEVLVGEHPFHDVPAMTVPDRHLHEPLPSARERRRELSPGVDEVIATATAKDPDLRFRDALEMAAAFREAITPGHAVAAPTGPPIKVRNPYKGLRPFTEADANDFFGREAFVQRLLARWRDPSGAAQSRFLAVVGPSGSGKSSAVRAGLVPALRAGAVDGSAGWFITEMVPGRHPMEELEAALLRVAAQSPPGLLGLLESGPRGLIDAADRITPEGSELVLLVDQFEEVFTLTESEAERSLLLESLRVAVADPASRVRVIATLRADFYDRPLNYQRFGELLGVHTEVVTPLAPDELERAIVGPTEPLGLSVEPALVAHMASDVAEQPGALPLVQYALTELFERRDDGRLALSAYRDIGGVAGALAARAEQLYTSRDAAGREAMRQLFLRLVTLGEGGADTRRRVPRSELAGIEVEPEAIRSALDAFGRHRLLSFDRDPATREPTVEVAHEALLRSWPRLRGWIEAAREDLRTLRRVSDAATEWRASGRDRSYLLTGSRLEQVETWAASTGLAIGHTEREFVRESLSRREAEIAAETARAAREQGLERRSNKRLRALVAVLTAGVLVAGTLTAIAVDRNSTAQRATRLAFARELAAASFANLEVDRELAVLLALESLRINDGVALPQAEESLRRAGTAVAIDAGTVLGRGVNDVSVASDGSAVAVVGGDGSVGVWDLPTGRRTFVDPSPEPCGISSCPDVRSVSISDDGSTLATLTPATSEGYNVFHVWNLASGRETFTVAPTPGLFDQGFVLLSPDGSMLATGEWDTIKMYSVGTERPMWTLDGLGSNPAARFLGSTPSLRFSPDGKHLLFGMSYPSLDGGPGLIDVTTGTALFLVRARSLEVGRGGMGGEASFSADGGRVAFIGGPPADQPGGGDLIVWDVASRKQIATMPSMDGPVALSPDGSVVAGTGVDDRGTVRLLDAETLELIGTLRGHAGSLVTQIGFARRGSKIVTASLDGTVRVWDARTGELIFTPPAEPTGVESVAFNGDGSQIIVIHADGKILAYPVALEDAIEFARSRVKRSLTDEECREYLHVETCPST